ncbi:MAG: bifunctional riboflavin kinase/FAD synthetase [Reyranellaceae bacterium]
MPRSSPMRVYRHYDRLPAADRGSVVAIGNFDGVHRGHQAVIGEARKVAAALGAPSAVLTFEPHPRSFFRPDDKPFRLTPLRLKAHAIEALGVDLLFVVRFDAQFAAYSAERFVAEVIGRAGLGARHVVTGYDFVFGKGRSGNAVLLERLAKEHGYSYTAVSPVAAESGEIYSSTQIRAYLQAGKAKEAARLLGRHWEIEGRVETGQQRGRTIGFPTANVRLADVLQPAHGVYAVRAGVDQGADTQWYDGVANFGSRPTVDGRNVWLEIHLFDFSGDLYGKHLRVAFVDFLRAEMKFPSFEDLKAQIVRDGEVARSLLRARR